MKQGHRVGLLEAALVIFILVLFSGADVRLLLAGGATSASEEVSRLFFWPAYLVIVGLAVRHRRPVLASGNWPIMTVALFAVASSIWSVDPATTVRESIILCMT